MLPISEGANMQNIRNPRGMRSTSMIVGTLAMLVVFPVAAARVAAGASPVPTGREPSSEGRAAPSVGLTLLAGLVRPICHGNLTCDGSFRASPSLEALVLYQPNETWAFGLVGLVERLHWTGGGFSMIDGTPYTEVHDIMGGFGGFAARFVPRPERSLTPVVQVALGWVFQSPGRPFECGHRVAPGGQLAVGGRARVSSSAFVFGMVSARGVTKDDTCSISDVLTTPFAGWAFGFHAGAAFDVALGHTRSETSITAR